MNKPNPVCPMCLSNEYVTRESPLKDLEFRPDEWYCSECDFAWLVSEEDG